MGKIGKAPCGHDGECVFGNFYTCLVGCDTVVKEEVAPPSWEREYIGEMREAIEDGDFSDSPDVSKWNLHRSRRYATAPIPMLSAVSPGTYTVIDDHTFTLRGRIMLPVGEDEDDVSIKLTEAMHAGDLTSNGIMLDYTQISFHGMVSRNFVHVRFSTPTVYRLVLQYGLRIGSTNPSPPSVKPKEHYPVVYNVGRQNLPGSYYVGTLAIPPTDTIVGFLRRLGKAVTLGTLEVGGVPDKYQLDFLPTSVSGYVDVFTKDGALGLLVRHYGITLV